MRRDEAQARDRRRAVAGPQPVDRPEQLGEVRPAVAILVAADRSFRVDPRKPLVDGQVVAVAVHVLAEEGHLAISGGGQNAGLGNDLVERAAALGTAAERDDAVGAGLVAAVDDRQPGRRRRLAPDRAVRKGRGTTIGEVVGGPDEGSTDQRRHSCLPMAP